MVGRRWITATVRAVFGVSMTGLEKFELGLLVVTAGLLGLMRGNNKVRDFLERYRFPASLTTSATFDELGLKGSSTPLWLLVDLTSTIVMASGIRNVSYAFPLQYWSQLGRSVAAQVFTGQFPTMGTLWIVQSRLRRGLVMICA
jgi:hypothetical protein